MASAGAEHFVVAQLMFRDIDAFKCERGRAGVDIVAADTRRRTSVGIQVKSRYDRASDGFPIVTPKADGASAKVAQILRFKDIAGSDFNPAMRLADTDA